MNAKIGDWAVYTTTSAQFKSTMRQEVVAIKGKLVTVKFTSTVNGLDLRLDDVSALREGATGRRYIKVPAAPTKAPSNLPQSRVVSPVGRVTR